MEKIICICNICIYIEQILYSTAQTHNKNKLTKLNTNHIRVKSIAASTTSLLVSSAFGVSILLISSMAGLSSRGSLYSSISCNIVDNPSGWLTCYLYYKIDVVSNYVYILN